MNGLPSRTRWVFQLLLAAVSVGIVFGISRPGYAASGPGCLIVTVPESIELPDGSVYPAGDLTLCLGRPLSPVTALHRVSVGGLPVGMLLSRKGLSEGRGSAEPSVLFRRVGADRLRLVGYAWPSGDRSLTYLLRDPGESARRFREEPSAADETARQPRSPRVLLAARTGE